MKFANIVSALALGSTLLAQPALAQQELDTAKSEVQFTARQMGVPLDGHFKKFDAEVAFDPAKLATSKITFTVDTGSATLGSKETDAELPKAVWFNVPKFPQATFESSAIKALGGKRWQALHRTVYVVAGLAVLHFFWMRAGKNNFGEVAIYAAILGALLGWRLWHRLRKRSAAPVGAAARRTAAGSPGS